jgi:hypothetical protein
MKYVVEATKLTGAVCELYAAQVNPALSPSSSHVSVVETLPQAVETRIRESVSDRLGRAMSFVRCSTTVYVCATP